MEGPAGTITPTGITSLDGNEYEISFAAQTQRGTYTVSVGSDIADLAGNLMDQDQDGVSGESQDDVHAFTVDAYDADSVFVASMTIAADNTGYDGQDICVSGATVTIDGTHTFKSVQVIQGGIITHSAASTLGVDLNVTNEVIVSATSRITANGKGYGSSSGPGEGQDGSDAAGAGYGGEGGRSNAVLGGVTYGSITEPSDLGSGGGAEGGTVGGSGGGAIRLDVGGTLYLEGDISADGSIGGSWGFNAQFGGGGSGGSIWIETEGLLGSGNIGANGGNSGGGSAGGGGGGRIAIYYDTDTFTGSVTAYGGTGYQRGGAGTIYTQVKSEAWGDLLIDNGSNWGAPTLLVDDEERLEQALGQMTVTVANRAIVYPESGLTVGILHVAADGQVSHAAGEATFDLRVLQDATIDAGGVITANGKGYGSSSGPGEGQDGSDAAGAGYGGEGGRSNAVLGGVTYGSITEPSDLGSGGGAEGGTVGGSGGGAIRLDVGGTAGS